MSAFSYTAHADATALNSATENNNSAAIMNLVNGDLDGANINTSQIGLREVVAPRNLMFQTVVFYLWDPVAGSAYRPGRAVRYIPLLFDSTITTPYFEIVDVSWYWDYSGSAHAGLNDLWIDVLTGPMGDENEDGITKTSLFRNPEITETSEVDPTPYPGNPLQLVSSPERAGGLYSATHIGVDGRSETLRGSPYVVNGDDELLAICHAQGGTGILLPIVINITYTALHQT